MIMVKDVELFFKAIQKFMKRTCSYVNDSETTKTFLFHPFDKKVLALDEAEKKGNEDLSMALRDAGLYDFTDENRKETIFYGDFVLYSLDKENWNAEFGFLNKQLEQIAKGQLTMFIADLTGYYVLELSSKNVAEFCAYFWESTSYCYSELNSSIINHNLWSDVPYVGVIRALVIKANDQPHSKSTNPNAAKRSSDEDNMQIGYQDFTWEDFGYESIPTETICPTIQYYGAYDVNSGNQSYPHFPTYVQESEKNYTNYLSHIGEVKFTLFGEQISYPTSSLYPEKLIESNRIILTGHFFAKRYNGLNIGDLSEMSLNPAIDDIVGFMRDHMLRLMNLFSENAMRYVLDCIENELFTTTVAAEIKHKNWSYEKWLSKEDNRNNFFEKLPGVRYFSAYLTEATDLLDDYQTTKSDIGQSPFQIRGGGFGVKGFVKGAVTATVMNAALNGIYSAGKAASFASRAKKAKTKIDEFLSSENSRKMVSLLWDIDLHYLLFMTDNALSRFVKLWNQSDIKSWKISNAFRGMDPSAYLQASEYYLVAMAKVLKLENGFPPHLYEDEEDWTVLSPLELMQKAILAFPFEKAYYIQYSQLGGSISNELLAYAKLYNIDINSIFEEQKLHNEKKRKEEEEKIKEAAKKQEQEELRREQEEVKSKIAHENDLRTLRLQFGKLLDEYPELFEVMPQNVLYKNAPENTYRTIDELAQYVHAFCGKNIMHRTFLPFYQNFQQKFMKAKAAYAKTADIRSAIVVYDDTIFGGAKNGFVLTRDTIFICNLSESPVQVALRDIRCIEFGVKYLLLNHTIQIKTDMNDLPADSYIHMIHYCICQLLIMDY